jgi:hypothetical protein
MKRPRPTPDLSLPILHVLGFRAPQGPWLVNITVADTISSGSVQSLPLCCPVIDHPLVPLVFLMRRGHGSPGSGSGRCAVSSQGFFCDRYHFRKTWIGSPRGSQPLNSAPASARFAAVRSPPWALKMRLAMVSPIPVPPVSAFLDFSAR